MKKSEFYKYIRNFLEVFIVLIICVLALIASLIIFPEKIYSDNWLKVDDQDGELTWVDTSHWEHRQVYISDGYYRDVLKKRWVDTSHTVSQGHWATGEYRVWVEAKETVPYTYLRWVDTSHWETRYRYVDALIPVSFTVIYGTDSYGWSVYSFASRPAGMQQVYYMGSKYLAEKWVIDYRPYMGGSVYAVKYRFMYRFGTQRQSYSVWVSSGYWQSVTAYRVVDNSHWETRTGKYWVDTSYRVENGYWENYSEREWVETGHFEYRDEWVKEGHFEEPLHGSIKVVKEPKYIFTRWHKNEEGDQCGMDLKVEWDIYDTETVEGDGSADGTVDIPKKVNICRVYIFEEVKRYADRGIDKVVIYDGEVDKGSQGSIETFNTFDFAGDEDSILNIFLYAEDGRSVHAYFSNPVNGYRSINLDHSGTSKDPASWSGGNNTGEVEF